jgi:hypothetical protein
MFLGPHKIFETFRRDQKSLQKARKIKFAFFFRGLPWVNFHISRSQVFFNFAETNLNNRITCF